MTTQNDKSTKTDNKNVSDVAGRRFGGGVGGAGVDPPDPQTHDPPPSTSDPENLIPFLIFEVFLIPVFSHADTFFS